MSILVCTYYRQWILTKSLSNKDSDTMSSQCNRYKIYSNQLSKASKENKDIIILTDKNISISDDQSNISYLKNISLKELWDKIL